ncbi:universal stress protein [Raineyella sp. LH-20]|uniref:universal stress protein n=1 Tax=Raineyella sp. LH-20 TaxID=3081204 RepID=UPI002954FE4F|nr:universal stress protein [Raineyella sp. LH-20]WOP18058.1 universal stress protein [Raineyella sp. LH-20]
MVAHSSSDEGRAALAHAVARARHHHTVLHVVSREPAVPDDVRDLLEGLTWEWEQCGPGDDFADQLLRAACASDGSDDCGAPAIVIGLRRRTTEGRLLLGHTAERVLLEAPCPVVTVKCGWVEPSTGAGA